MSAVYKRELRAYMSNVYGWLFMAVLLLFTGFMVFLENLVSGYPHIEYALLDSEYVLLLMIPILCMRSMAEDKRNKTDMFYLSLPMQTSAVVLGKYFALLTIYAIPCLVIGVYPLVLGLYGNVNFLSGYVSLLFFFLLGAALIAVCQFLSSLTDNLVVAAVLGVAASAILYFLPMLSYVIPTSALASFIGLVVVALIIAAVAFVVTRNLNVTAITGTALILPLSLSYILAGSRFAGLLPTLLERVAPFLQFEEVSNYGLFSVPALILLLSYPVFFVFLTVQSADKKRWA